MLMIKKVKKEIKNKFKLKIFKKAKSFAFGIESRDSKIEDMKICEEQLRVAIKQLMSKGKEHEEIIGYITSLTVCLVSSEMIKQRNK